MPPKISIIIPAHNEENYLPSTFDSILSQTYGDYEIIVVCDSCTDRTEGIAREYKAGVLDVAFKKAGATRNAGTKNAQGQVFVFHDADTIMADNYLDEVSKAASQGVAYGSAPFRAETENILGKFLTALINNGMRKSKTTGGNVFVQREIFDKVGGFDESLIKWEDTVFSEMAKKYGSYKFLDRTYIVPSQRKQKGTLGYLKCIYQSIVDPIKYCLSVRLEADNSNSLKSNRNR